MAASTQAHTTKPPASKPARERGPARRNLFWIALAAPGIIWLILLFIIPFYAVLAIAMGQLNRLFESPIAVWNPAGWNASNIIDAYRDVVGPTSFAGPIVIRTIIYVAIASLLCLVIGYPAAYFVARFAGRRKALFLVLLIAPFWISYMMRMLAWVDLLQTGGYLNRALMDLDLTSHQINWLGGMSVTVILGLVYGYVPYMILPLFAGLDRLPQSALEAARDLGASRVETFRRVILPMSRPTVVASLLLTSLPMLGDYFTNDLLSGSPSTAMVGNLINETVLTPGESGLAGAFVLLVLLVSLIPMIYYVRSSGRESVAT